MLVHPYPYSSSYLDKIIEACKTNDTAVNLLTQLNQADPSLFFKHVETLWSFYVSFDSSKKSSVRLRCSLILNR